MKKDTLIKEIQEYLSGELSPENKAVFEQRLKSEQDMQNDLQLTKKVIEGVEGAAFKEMLLAIHSKRFGSRPKS